MRDEFISAVSHDLRTPLTSVRGALDLMVGGVTGDLPDEAMALAKIAQGNCERLVRLISDVLDIEKIEAGRMELRLQTIELGTLIEQSVESIRPYGEQLGVDFQVESSAPGARVRLDPDRLVQVMENLLSNAAKFSPYGETVRVTLARRGTQLRVAVTDRGPGIPQEFHSRLFEKFAQIDPPSGRQKGGTGLGLNIARAIVGAVRRDDRFLVRARRGNHLPLRSSGVDATEREEGVPALKIEKIMIVDDDDDICTVAKLSARRVGNWEVVVATSGQEAARQGTQMRALT